MSTRRGGKKFASLLVCAALLSGCAIIGGKYVIEESFTEEQVKLIRNNQTTKAEILAWFGPPAAIARQGITMKVPMSGVDKRGCRDMPSEKFLALFAEKQTLTRDHLVYYYQDSSLHWVEIVIDKADVATTPVTRVRKLWVLINEKTGLVEDTLLREEEAKKESDAEAGAKRKPEPGTGNTRQVNPVLNSGEKKL